MTTPVPAPSERSVASERAEQRTIGKRRRRVIRSVFTVVVVTLAMVFLSALNRSVVDIRSCRERMQYAVDRFQERYDFGDRRTVAFPLPDSAADDPDSERRAQRLRAHVYYNPSPSDSRAGAWGEIGVCCCRRPHNRLFRPAGRHVILFNFKQVRYELRWMEEDEFAREAPRLNLPFAK